MTTPDIIAAIRSLWNNLTPAEQQDLYDAVAALRHQSAVAEANAYQDPMVRFFAKQLLPAEPAPKSAIEDHQSPPTIEI